MLHRHTGLLRTPARTEAAVRARDHHRRKPGGKFRKQLLTPTRIAGCERSQVDWLARDLLTLIIQAAGSDGAPVCDNRLGLILPLNPSGSSCPPGPVL